MTSQEEELEVLESIYGDDPCYKKVSNTKFQYQFGETDTFKSFILEIEWTENYPENPPVINLDIFYNQHLSQTFKSICHDKLSNLALQEIGNPLTYILFEHIRENLDEYFELITSNVEVKEDLATEGPNTDTKKVKTKKEQLTKSQKRRLLNKYDEHGEIPRGSDWVSVLRHLQQVGTQC